MHRRELHDIPKIGLVGAVDHDMIKSFDAAYRDLFNREERPSRAALIVSTCGGSTGYAWGVYERIRLLAQEMEVWFFGLGVVYSAGLHLMLAVPKERRITTPNTRFLFHTVQRNDHLPMKNTIDATALQLQELLSDVEEQKRYKDFQIEAIARDTGISPEELTSKIASGWYFGGQEAVDIGLVGALLDES